MNPRQHKNRSGNLRKLLARSIARLEYNETGRNIESDI